MDSINTKTTAQIIILKAMKRAGDTGDWMTAYYSIKTLELIMNLKNRYLFTDEELQIIKDTFKPDHDSIKSKDTTSETIERGESLEEIFGSAKKKRLNLFDGLEI